MHGDAWRGSRCAAATRPRRRPRACRRRARRHRASSAGPGSARRLRAVFASRLITGDSSGWRSTSPTNSQRSPSGSASYTACGAAMPAERVHVHVAGRRRHRRAEQVLRRHRAFHRFARLHRSRSSASRRRGSPAGDTPPPGNRRVHRLLVGHLVVGPRPGLVARAKLLGLLRHRLVALEDGAHRVRRRACLRPEASAPTRRCSRHSPSTVRSATSRSWPSRTESSTAVPAGSSRMPCGVLWRRIAFNRTSSPSR